MKDYFNCQETPLMLGMWDQDDKILRRYPIEPLHVFLLGRLVYCNIFLMVKIKLIIILGSPNDLLGLLEDERDAEGNLVMEQFYEKHNLTKDHQGEPHIQAGVHVAGGHWSRRGRLLEVHQEDLRRLGGC